MQHRQQSMLIGLYPMSLLKNKPKKIKNQKKQNKKTNKHESGQRRLGGCLELSLPTPDLSQG